MSLVEMGRTRRGFAGIVPLAPCQKLTNRFDLWGRRGYNTAWHRNRILILLREGLEPRLQCDVHAGEGRVLWEGKFLLSVIFVVAPGIIAAFCHCRWMKIPLKSIDYLVYTLMYTFLVMAFTMGIIYMRGFGSMEPMGVFASLQSVVKYCVVATAAALAMPNVLALLLKRIGWGDKDAK